jgi:hypothetical protein
MNLIKVTKKGALHFELLDGRIGAIYPSGYVRVCSKGVNYYNRRRLMYQINKRKKEWYNRSIPWGYNLKRVKEPNLIQAFKLLQNFEDNNCKNSSNVTMEGFKCNSRAIEAAEYEVNNKRLTVFFKNGSIYNYSDVPLRVYNDFRSSTSKGSFLNNVLKGFNFNKITV